MPQKPVSLTSVRAPRAAAIAGIIFSILLMTSFILIRVAVPANPLEAGVWLQTGAGKVVLALNLVPFAGVAFLWFIGVVRDRLGAYEDRFFATVFLGSGLLFLALLFVTAAVAGGLIVAYAQAPSQLVATGVYGYGRAVIYELMNIYTMKMAGVFMISTCVLSLRTAIVPRWMAFLGLALALFLILSMQYTAWGAVLFPLWVLLVSVYILVENLRPRHPATPPKDP